mmetsp:Transcript_36799/g.94977  ORF Transcript_36799/g.94977 Transcript_36799/m.94977 type:complete len:176 (-) Transcript_36799:100-627(-)
MLGRWSLPALPLGGAVLVGGGVAASAAVRHQELGLVLAELVLSLLSWLALLVLELGDTREPHGRHHLEPPLPPESWVGIGGGSRRDGAFAPGAADGIEAAPGPVGGGGGGGGHRGGAGACGGVELGRCLPSRSRSRSRPCGCCQGACAAGRHTGSGGGAGGCGGGRLAELSRFSR